MAYARRMEFEAQVQAVAIVELLAQVLIGKSHGTTDEGRVFNRTSTEDGLAHMGVSL